jgi:hypothetical protein
LVIEQAVYTSARTDRAQGYQLIGRSPGLSDADARELATWGPSHDSLLEGHGSGASTNFHPLTSGAYSVSRTTSAGAEYSGRGGAQVYTQFLIVPPEVLSRFANNPFAVLRAATAAGVLRVYEQVPEVLEPLNLFGRAPAVDSGVVAQIACKPGAAALATLVQAALATDQLAVATETPVDALFAALFSVLPIECRTEFSFSTGLKYSPSRVVRISALPSDPASWRGIARSGVTLLNLDSEEVSQTVRWEGWAGCIADILRSGRLSLLAARLERVHPGLNCGNLASFADEIEAALHPGVAQTAEHVIERPPESAGKENAARPMASRADRAHARFAGSASATAAATKTGASGLMETLAHQPPEVLELLERVDDLVFAAIAGDEPALRELQVLWPTVVADLEPELIDQSRDQYLRCSLSIWSECVDDQLQRTERAVSAIDVLCVLFEE